VLGGDHIVVARHDERPSGHLGKIGRD
jgi:hypothetical protein